MNEAKMEKLSRAIGYHFKDESLLVTALTHSSYANEHGTPYEENNERMEFLGDAFFDAVIAERLCLLLPREEEGKLSKIRASIVCEESLVRKASELNLSGYVLLGNGEAKNAKTFGYKAYLADALEAIFGAVYLDSSYEQVREVILNLFHDVIQDGMKGSLNRDYKSMLQEKLQTGGEVRIQYEIIDETGPDHDKTFYAVVKYQGMVIGSGSGKTKKSAEQNAAGRALAAL